MKTQTILFIALLLAASAFAEFNVRDFGAVADGKTKCTTAIRKAIDAAAKKGGGTVWFPAGTYLTGPIHLKSHITLRLDAGATVKFSTDFDDYLPMVPARWEGVAVMNFSPPIYAYRAENIAITGRGTLDGQGRAWWEFYRKAKDTKWQQEFARLNKDIIAEMNYAPLNAGFLRPPLVQPYECTNVLIEGVTLVNSPFWNINPVFCENVNVRGVTILCPEDSPNTDGINPDSCRNVRISDCYISAGDDCITLKSGRDADGRRIGKPLENVTIVNCTLLAGHGLSIGSEMSAGVRNVTIANCVFDGTDRCIRIKSTRGRGGVVEDIRVSNIIVRNIRKEAILLTTFYTKTQPEPVSERTPVFRNIHFSEMTGGANVAGAITGLEEMPVENVTFRDVRLNGRTGLAVKDAKGIEFHDVTINAQNGPALTATGVDGLEIAGLKGSGDALIQLSKVKNVSIRHTTVENRLQVDDDSVHAVTVDGRPLGSAKEAGR